MKLSGAYYCQTMDLYLSIINFVAVVIYLTTLKETCLRMIGAI